MNLEPNQNVEDLVSQQLFGQPREITFSHPDNAAQLETSLREHQSRLTLEDTLDVAAIPNQSLIQELDFHWHENNELVIRVHAQNQYWGVETQQEFIFFEQEPSLFIDSLHLDPTGQQIGTRIFAHQVNKAARLGFQRIELFAVRGREANGYYTWARLGFDATFDSPQLENIRTNFAEHTGFELPDSIFTLHDLLFGFEDNLGMDFWRVHGFSMDMIFNLSSEANSMLVLNDYLDQKHIRTALEW